MTRPRRESDPTVMLAVVILILIVTVAATLYAIVSTMQGAP